MKLSKNLETKEKKEYKRVIGLDLSILSPGLADYCVKTGKFTYCDNPSFAKYKDKPMNERIIKIMESIMTLVVKRSITDTLIIVENVHMNALKINSSKPLIILHGVICMDLLELGLDVKTIEPTSARSHLQIKPNNKLGGFEYIVEKKYEGLEHITDFKKHNDMSDAAILCLNYDNLKLKEFGE